MDDTGAEETWQDLKVAIQRIHNREDTDNLSFEELYRKAYYLVLYKFGEKLYNGVRDTVIHHLQHVAEEVASAADEALLQSLQQKYQDHTTHMQMLKDVLMYMDRNYVKQQKKDTVHEMGLILFRREVADHQFINDRVLTLVLQHIQSERNGHRIDQCLMRKTMQMFVDLGITVYKNSIEQYYLAETQVFYSAEAASFHPDNTVPEYLRKADERILEEEQRVMTYMNESSLGLIMSIVEDELIRKQHKSLIHTSATGCGAMFNDDKLEDMQRLYQLFKRVPSTLSEVKVVMRKSIRDKGEMIVKDPEKLKDPVNYVDGLLELKKKYDSFIRVSFEESQEFQACHKAAFEELLNKDTRTAQFLAFYTDVVLRRSVKTLSDRDIESKLEQVISLFRFLHDKDVFESVYKTHLARRLLQQRTATEDGEKHMIQKLKVECGHTYTSKLEGMFHDIRLSDDMMKDYYQEAELSKHSSSLEIVVNVLTTGCWPQPLCPAVELPRELAEECEMFERYYLRKHTGRKLTWHFGQGSAEIRAMWRNARHELSLSTYQACILCLFNLRSRVTFSEMLELTRIPADELKRHLVSLYISPKCKMLVKLSTQEEPSRTVLPHDVFEVNEAFESKLVRIRVPMISVGSRGLEGSPCDNAGGECGVDVPLNVEEDRKHLVEAAIVRIMKMRKRLEHNQLISEVTRHISHRFCPAPLMVKQRIEKLIDREYLARAPDNRREYNYLA